MNKKIGSNTTATRLRMIRKKHKQKQIELERDLNLAKNKITKIEKDNNSMDLESLIKICMYYNITSDWMVGLTNNGDEKSKIIKNIDLKKAEQLYNLIPERLRNLRLKRGSNQLEIAIIMNIERGTISKYELGMLKLKVDRLIQFAYLYNVSSDEILGLSELKK